MYFERRRWHGHAVCPHCGCDEKISARGGKRVGYYRCGDCRQEFTVRTKTIFERSHVPLNKWLYAMYYRAREFRPYSFPRKSAQKTAWFMLGRLREACGGDTGKLVGTIEIDEVYMQHEQRQAQGIEGHGLGHCGQAGRARNARARGQVEGHARTENGLRHDMPRSPSTSNLAAPSTRTSTGATVGLRPLTDAARSTTARLRRREQYPYQQRGVHVGGASSRTLRHLAPRLSQAPAPLRERSDVPTQ